MGVNCINVIINKTHARRAANKTLVVRIIFSPPCSGLVAGQSRPSADSKRLFHMLSASSNNFSPNARLWISGSICDVIRTPPRSFSKTLTRVRNFDAIRCQNYQKLNIFRTLTLAARSDKFIAAAYSFNKPSELYFTETPIWLFDFGWKSAVNPTYIQPGLKGQFIFRRETILSV